MSANITSANTGKPTLQGCRIALTVDADDPYTPEAALLQLGATILHYPAAQMLPPDDYELFDAALHRCQKGEIDWLLLTTPRAVEALAQRMDQLAIEPSDMGKTKLALFGAKTSRTLARRFPNWKFTLEQADSHQQLVTAMQLQPEQVVLMPVAARSRADWFSLLHATEAEVILAPAYRLILGRGGDDLPSLLWAGMIDAVVFLTENSVRHFVTRLTAEGGTKAMLDHVVIAALDPQTAAAAIAFGLRVQVIPTQHTTEELARSLAQHFSNQPVGT